MFNFSVRVDEAFSAVELSDLVSSFDRYHLAFSGEAQVDVDGMLKAEGLVRPPKYARQEVLRIFLSDADFVSLGMFHKAVISEVTGKAPMECSYEELETICLKIQRVMNAIRATKGKITFTSM